MTFRFLNTSPKQEKKNMHRHRRIATGGPLNFLNEAARTNSREKSVPVMALVAYHRPPHEEALESLIEQHCRLAHSSQCPCGVKSRGTVTDFGNNLYEAQQTCEAYKQQYPDQRAFTRQECYTFMRNLFCVAPLRGLRQEETSVSVLRKAIPGIVVTLATRSEDFDYAVDYIVTHRGRDLGVQVKPESFFNKEDCVVLTKEKHARFRHPVLFHTYSNRTMEFLEETTRKIIDFFDQVV